MARTMASTEAAESKVRAVEWMSTCSSPVNASSRRSMSTPSGVHWVVLDIQCATTSSKSVGALGFFVDLKTIQDSIGAIPVPDGSVVTVVDRDGRLLARSVQSDRYVGQLLPVDLRPVKR